MIRVVVLSFLLFAGDSFALVDELGEFDDLAFESLLATDVQVTSAMKRTQIASKTAASVYVITKEQIASSGVSSVAESLTLAPGMQVRRIDNNKWAIGIRNPSGRYTSKVLVMVDGQSIYNPSFSGVYWEALNLPVYDIERIEIVRGQGGILWGSNATNGVVNIITKHSIDTRSTRLSASTGTRVDHDISMRFGGDLDFASNTSYRLYVNDQSTNASDQGLQWAARDTGKKQSIGGRIDIAFNDDTSILVQGDYTDIKAGQTLKLASLDTFENRQYIGDQKRVHKQLMLRMDNRISDTANQMLQLSLSKQSGDQPYYMENFTHYDADYQLNTIWGDSQFDFGLHYRLNQTPFIDSDYITSLSGIDSLRQYGAFFQVSFPLIPEKVDLILGNKSEHNSLTGWEHQPLVRLAWNINDSQFFWASVSQGIRIPSLAEFDYSTRVVGTEIGDLYSTGLSAIDDLRINTLLLGSDEVQSEKTVSAEFGYRIIEKNWGVDLSLFYAKSKNASNVSTHIDPNIIATFEHFISTGNFQAALDFIPEQTIEINFNSELESTSSGGELIFNWMPASDVKYQLGYSHAEYEFDGAFNSPIDLEGITEQIFLSLNGALTEKHSLHTIARWEDGSIYNTESYIDLDLSWRWQVSENTAVMFMGNNLLNNSQLEYARTNEQFEIPTYIDRRFSISLTIIL